MKNINNFKFIISHIEWDTEYEDELDYLPDMIEIPLEEIPNIMTVDGLSDYISNITGYCHKGYFVNCNAELSDLYEAKNKIEEELSLERLDGKIQNTSDLQQLLEKIDAAIDLSEELFRELSEELFGEEPCYECE